MKRSTANSKNKKEKSKKTESNSDKELEEKQEEQEEQIKEQEFIQLMLNSSQEIDESEDLDLMSPTDFIAAINDSYILRKHTGRSRLKFHPKKITIKNYW
jgi:hypothetical protein